MGNTLFRQFILMYFLLCAFSLSACVEARLQNQSNENLVASKPVPTATAQVAQSSEIAKAR